MSDKGKEKKKAKKARRSYHPVLLITSVCVLVLAALAVAFDQFQMYRFEQGLLDVCAAQQDAYVQLVLDQININQDRDEEDIIDILETMDGSTNKYWTFSREQSMLFVKDVLETNRYQGFTTGTYYISDSARDFLDGLQLNRVIHKNIVMQEKEYIASGVAFTYRGESYRLCLLTNKSVMLDNNKFLGARTELNILFICLILLLIVVPMLFARKVRNLQRERDEQSGVIVELNSKLTELNKLLSEQDIRDTRHNVWSGDALDDFAEKLRERGLVPSTIIKVRCSGGDVSQELLRKAGTVMDRSVLRFLTSEGEEEFVSFLFVGSDHKTAMSNIEILLRDGIQIEESLCLMKERRWSKEIPPEEGKAEQDQETQSIPTEYQNLDKEDPPEIVTAKAEQKPEAKSLPKEERSLDKALPPEAVKAEQSPESKSPAKEDRTPAKPLPPKEVKAAEKQKPEVKSLPKDNRNPDKEDLPKIVTAEEARRTAAGSAANSLKSRKQKETRTKGTRNVALRGFMNSLKSTKWK